LTVKPKDRDFIQTVDKQLFCVVGYLHPTDGYTAYLKYVPSSDGKWERNGQRYSRTLPFYHVSQVENTYAYLKAIYPQYLFDCPVRNITLSWVPKTHVKQYYKPMEKLVEINSRGAGDTLEQKLLDLSSLLSEKVDEKSLGITGSILTGTHNPSFSDIDLTVYGYYEAIRLIKALEELKEEGKRVKLVSRKEKTEWVNNRAKRFPLSKKDLEKIADKRWNYGYIDGTYFSVHPTRTDEEIVENFGDNMYHRKGAVRGTATVSGNNESIYLPAVYMIEDVKTEEGNEEITQLVSFEGLYGSLFEVGEEIVFEGIIEEIRGKNPGYRVLVGGAGSPNSYVKWAYSG
jgi:predicted nucleotidyltransferase